MGVITRDKLKWLLAELTAYNMTHQILILSAMIKCTLILNQSLLTVAKEQDC